MITLKKKTSRCRKKTNLVSANPSSSEGLEERFCFMLNVETAFAAKTYNVPLIILSSFNMYFINLFFPTLTATDVDLIQCVSNRTCLSSSCQLHLWCLPHKGRQRWQGSEMEVTSITFGIILPGDNLSLENPIQCTQGRTVWSLLRVAQKKETVEGGLKAVMINNSLSYLRIWTLFTPPNGSKWKIGKQTVEKNTNDIETKHWKFSFILYLGGHILFFHISAYPFVNT